MLDALLNLQIPAELIVLLIAMLPIAELRVAIPVGIHSFNMPWFWATPVAIVGNMLPVPILLLFFDALAKIVIMVQPGRQLMDWVFRRTRKNEKIIQRYEWLGLALFVGIPLPFTGAWTGSIAAFIMGLPFWQSLLSIFCGVLMSSVIVTVLSLLGWIGAVIAGIALVIVIILGWRQAQ